MTTIVQNSLGIDLPVAVWLASNTYTGNVPGKSISATTLLRSTQQQVLELKCSKDPNIVEVVDISTLQKSRTGTALHESIQNTWENDELRRKGLKNLGFSDNKIEKVLVNPTEPKEGFYNMFFERRVQKEFNGWTITGQFDLVCNGTLHDFKSTSTYTYTHKTKEKDYIIQGSIYRWLNPELITSDVMVINYIFTDWSAVTLKKGEEDYPQHPFVAVQLPLMSIAETENYMREKLDNIDAYLDGDIADLPPCDSKTLMMEDVWQYFSSGTALRASKNFTTFLEAQQYLASKGKGIVKKKPTEPKGCSYCNSRCICKQYQKFIEQGLIQG